MKHLALLCEALLVLTSSAYATEVWSKGVSWTSGWYDANKKGDTDTQLCWAATASNMINWWQSQFSALPAGTPTATTTQLAPDNAVWQAFRQSWTDKGGNPVPGLAWWFTGKAYNDSKTIDASMPALTSNPVKTGYFNNAGLTSAQITATFYDSGFPIEPSDCIYHDAWSISDDAKAETLLSTLLNGYASGTTFGLGMTASNGSGHEITLWGIDYTPATGEITKFFVTDSDDTMALSTYADKYQNHIYTMKVEKDTDGKLKLSSDDSISPYPATAGYYLDSVVSITTNGVVLNVPEPASSLLVLLGLTALLRRKSRI